MVGLGCDVHWGYGVLTHSHMSNMTINVEGPPLETHPYTLSWDLTGVKVKPSVRSNPQTLGYEGSATPA